MTGAQLCVPVLFFPKRGQKIQNHRIKFQRYAYGSCPKKARPRHIPRLCGANSSVNAANEVLADSIPLFRRLSKLDI